MTTDDTILRLAETCHLAEGERESRLARFRRDLLPQATATEVHPDGRAWEFDREPELERELEELVAFERGCCPGLGWNLRRVRGDTGLRLELSGLHPTPGPDPSPTSPAERPPRGRLAALAGVMGVAMSLGLLCGLPIILAAGGAAAMADSLAWLDDARWIGAVAVVAGGGTWWLLDRRATRRSEPVEPDCRR